mmetsp:Transcript_115403/g.368246  ORF Transcript_115403/g.368246 Transcript_115403/m.368246 type:complete len:256 (-) Transcript_115403:459-1226(-)
MRLSSAFPNLANRGRRGNSHVGVICTSTRGPREARCASSRSRNDTNAKCCGSRVVGFRGMRAATTTPKLEKAFTKACSVMKDPSGGALGKSSHCTCTSVRPRRDSKHPSRAAVFGKTSVASPRHSDGSSSLSNHRTSTSCAAPGQCAARRCGALLPQVLGMCRTCSSKPLSSLGPKAGEGAGSAASCRASRRARHADSTASSGLRSSISSPRTRFAMYRNGWYWCCFLESTLKSSETSTKAPCQSCKASRSLVSR